MVIHAQRDIEGERERERVCQRESGWITQVALLVYACTSCGLVRSLFSKPGLLSFALPINHILRQCDCPNRQVDPKWQKNPTS